jgi:transcriptional regulator with XRE-family HTH domain
MFRGMIDSGPVTRLLQRLREARESAGRSTEDIAKELILGPQWIERFESGMTLPDLNTLFVLIDHLGLDPTDVFADLRTEYDASPTMRRTIYAEQSAAGLIVNFEYAKFDAQYILEGATVAEFDAVLLTLRNGLARLVAPNEGVKDERQIKMNAVAAAFIQATQTWKHANPSDLWGFIMSRAYCDPYNHPADYARLNFDQSWKRTSGWALEEIVVRHYREELAKYDITIEIARGDRRHVLVDQFKVDNRLEADKIDVYLLGPDDTCFGVVHVKASLAERRTDDVPMSQTLMRGGYFSAFWTLDLKSTPSSFPSNKGELGAVDGDRSAKRKDFEDDGSFSACFSYNSNTQPTPIGGYAVSRIVTCDFSNPDDAFTSAVVEAWEAFKSRGKQ